MTKPALIGLVILLAIPSLALIACGSSGGQPGGPEASVRALSFPVRASEEEI